MLEIIQQHPLVSILVILVPIIGGIWKIMIELYVKPRDFRITVLEKNIDEIRKDIQKNDDKKTHFSSSKKDSERITDSEKEEKESKRIEKIVESTTLLNDMDLFYNSWQDKKLTDLQRAQFEKSYLNQKVVWEAVLSSVSEKNDGNLWASLTSKNKDSFGIHIIAVFDTNHREALLTINKGEMVVVSGLIDSFSLSPLLRRCSIIRKK